VKIIMVADQYPPIVGGAERQAQKLSQALARRGAEVVVLTGRWKPQMPSLEVEGSLRVERVSTLFSMGGLPGLRKYGRDVFARSLRVALRRHLAGADVVHAHFMQRGAIVSLEEASRFGVPVLVKETSSGPNNSFVRLPLIRHGQRMHDFFLEHLRHVAVLNESAEVEFKAEPFRQLRIHRIVNGIDLGIGHPIWSPGCSKRILFLGRLQEIKGAVDLVDAFSKAAVDLPGWTLRICGEGPERSQLEATVAQAGLQEKVEFRPFSSSPLQELADCSLLALPSLAEGMSNTLLEAMAVGTPTVATRVGANAEMLGPNCGWLAAPGDPSSLAEAILSASVNPEECLRRSQCARSRVAERYSFEVVASRFEALYREIRE
jgi:glycosyltransferase involved in cell wall biosynthesis